MSRKASVFFILVLSFPIMRTFHNNLNWNDNINETLGEHTNKNEGGNLAASKIRNLECPSYEICLIDYGCGKFNRKIHIMEQYP